MENHDWRNETKACHYHCMTKITYAGEILKKATKSHPRTLQREKAFNDLETEYNRLVKERLEKNLSNISI